MAGSGDAIRVSPEDIARRIRALADHRVDFPAPAAVAHTQGPANGASQAYRATLNSTVQHLSRLTVALTWQLEKVENLLEQTGRDLVAADESVADDVNALHRILGTVDEPAPPSSAPTSTSSGSTAFE